MSSIIAQSTGSIEWVRSLVKSEMAELLKTLKHYAAMLEPSR